MTRKLIALVDGSDYARSVCEHAAWIAGRTDMTVEVLHVLGRRETGGTGDDLSGQIALGARSALLKDLSALDEQRAKLGTQRGRAILEDARGILEQGGGTVNESLRRGDLLDAVDNIEADLVVVGKRGEGADFAKEHLGSNLERILRGTKRPLFVASRAFRPISSVLLAYDGSPSAMRAVDYVAGSPLYKGLTVHVVTVGQDTAKSQDALKEAHTRLGSAGIEAEIQILGGEPEHALPRLIEEHSIGHMVMGASGHTRLRSLFVGSTSLEMIRTCKVPILLVK